MLPQEDADVLLVALLLEAREKRKHPEVTSARIVEQEAAVALGEIAPGRFRVEPAGPRGLAQQPAPSLVARLRPGIERAPGERAAPVGDDQRFVVLEHPP